MARTILLSVHPEFVKKIVEGTKTYEFRKVVPRQDISGMLIYCTAPVKKVVAFVEITGSISGSPTRVWRETAVGAGISRAVFRDYFRERKTANALVLGEVQLFEMPCSLGELSSVRVPPQSFCYLQDRVVDAVREGRIYHRVVCSARLGGSMI